MNSVAATNPDSEMNSVAATNQDVLQKAKEAASAAVKQWSIHADEAWWEGRQGMHNTVQLKNLVFGQLLIRSLHDICETCKQPHLIATNRNLGNFGRRASVSGRTFWVWRGGWCNTKSQSWRTPPTLR